MRDSKNAIQFVRIAELLHNLSGGAFAQYANVRRISNPDNDIWHEILLSHMRFMTESLVLHTKYLSRGQSISLSSITWPS